ncbi:MAG: hypothetical protein ACYC9I_05375 [Desulfuromonadales bacterium]
MRNIMLYNQLILRLLAGALAVILTCAPAEARISGALEWNWADYSKEVDGEEAVSASHFVQKYSILANWQGQLNGGRAGGWALGLGYDWTSFDNEINGEDNSETRGKMLYEGEVLFAPGGLPIRFHGFSYDLTRTSLATLTRIGQRDHLIEPDIVNDLHNGQYITSGFTLIAGIRNGTYLGEYRELLSKYPRLFIDFRETYNKDDKSELYPEHTRDRDLAFVSLNKKDNWFHYKYRDYIDYNDANNNYTTKMFLLGTVDHLNRRQWIHLTNWIRLSVDGSLTISDDALETDTGGYEETYALNAFTVARRAGWEVSNFTSASRTSNLAGRLEKNLYIPFYGSGAIDPQTSWRGQLVFSREENEDSFRALRTDEDVAYAQLQLESRKNRGYLLTPEIELESRDASDGRGQAGRVGFELGTDSRYDRRLQWHSAYSAGYFDGETDNGEQTGFFEQRGLLAADYAYDSRTRFGVSQELIVGWGKYAGNTTNYLTPLISWARETFQVDADVTGEDGSAVRSLTTAYLELNGRERMRNRFSMSLDYLETPEEQVQRLVIEHRLDYSRRELELIITNSFQQGDDLSLGYAGQELAGLESAVSDPDLSFGHRTSLRYRPNRHWDVLGRLVYAWASGPENDGSLVAVEQVARYSVFSATAYARRLLQFNQEFHYEKLLDAANAWYSDFIFGAEYYPRSYWVLGARAAVRYYGEAEQMQLGYSLYSALRYPKFEARVAYAYAESEESDRDPQTDEQRVEVSLKRLF